MNAHTPIKISAIEVAPLAPVAGVIHDRWLAWHKHRASMLKALSECHGTHNEDDVLCRLVTGEYFIWANELCAVVGFFTQYPRMKGLNMFVAGGDMNALLLLQAGIELWAKTQGITRMVGGGRIGWRRIFHDYEDAGILMFKDI